MTFSNLISKALSSGTTTPESKTPSSSGPAQGLRHSDSQETLHSGMTTISEREEVESVQSYRVPDPPLNTPYGPLSEYNNSIAGDNPNEVDLDSLKEKLKGMPNSIETNTPPASVRGKLKGKVHFSTGVEVRDFAVWHDAVESLSWYSKLTSDDQLGSHGQLKQSPFKGTRGTKTPPAIVEFPEHSTWAGVAEEDVTSGLKRLTMLAKDENKLNPSKSVSEYFSERLAKLIKDAEPDFNPKALE
ncbi:hypothetical protein LTR86_002001 [Recurvomyces mirabilis]|nr:hypothetical protein LTR86_002001 [Recurvomyces mirabilis]